MSSGPVEMSVTEVSIYPVKSMQGVSLSRCSVGETGFVNDRGWMLIDDWGSFLSQRQHPDMALIRAAIAGDALLLTIPGRDPFAVPMVDDGPTIEANIVGHRCVVCDQGSLAAERIGEFLGRSCRLVRMARGFRREIGSGYRRDGDGPIGFPDGMPFLLTSTASLDDLNGRLHEPARMSRFRPNIVFDGGTPFVEEAWKRIRIGSATFRVPKKCLRCEMINVNQETGTKDIEPLEMLESYRSGAKGVGFGVNLIHETTGEVVVGDRLEVLE